MFSLVLFVKGISLRFSKFLALALAVLMPFLPGLETRQPAEVGDVVFAFLTGGIAGQQLLQAEIAGERGAFMIVFAGQHRRAGRCELGVLFHL